MTNESAHQPPDTADPERIDLRPIFWAVRRRWWVAALCAALAGTAAFFYSVTQDDTYKATASVMFRDPGLAQGLVGPQVPRYPAEVVQDVSLSTQILELDEIAERTAKELPGVEPIEVRGRVDIQQSGLANIYDVSAEDRDPGSAASLANEYARQAITVKRGIDRRMVDQALRRVEADLRKLENQIAGSPNGPSDREAARLQSLEDGLRALTIFSSLQAGNVTLLEPAAEPDEPFAPKPLENAAYGLLLGAIFGIALALLVDALTKQRARGSTVSDATDQ